MRAFIFQPKRTDDLKEPMIPFIGKVVHVRSWHADYKDSEKTVGNLAETYLDVPRDELVDAPDHQGCHLCEEMGHNYGY